MADQHRPILSPETLVRLAGALPEFSAAWSCDVAALRSAEADLAATRSLLDTITMRRDDLQADLDAAFADNKKLLDRNAYLEAQILLIADRAKDAENGMAAVRQRVDATVRGDGTVRDRNSPAPDLPGPGFAKILPAETLAKLAQVVEATKVASPAAAIRQVRELDADEPDGTDLPQEPPPIGRTPLPINLFGAQPAARTGT